MLNQIKVGTKMVCVTKSACSELKKFQGFGDFDDTKANNNQNKIVICLESEYLNNKCDFSEYEKIFILYIKDDYFGIYSIGDKLSGGCNECIRQHTDFLNFYDIEYNKEYRNLDINEIISNFVNHHNDNTFSYHYISKLGTSIFFPVIACEKCDLDRKNNANIVYNVSYQNYDVEIVKNSSGLRTLSPDDFCNKTSKFVGHSSCIKPLFPINSSNNADVFHYEAPLAIRNQDTGSVEFSGGKGLSVAQSMASCIGEGLERYFSSGKYLDFNNLFFASYNELCYQKKLALNPKDFFGLPFNFSFYSVEKPDHYIDYDDNLSIEWLKGKNLSTNSDILIPANMVFCPYVHSPSYSATSTNGMSAGGNLNECIIQGCLELIERDAFWFSSRTGLGIQSFQHIKDKFPLHEFPDLEFYFMLLFSEFGLPVAQVVIESKNTEVLPVTSRGTGCAFDVDTAFNRAFSEALQMYYSQRDTMEVDKKDEFSDMDMRWIWSSGKSKEIFPQFFNLTNEGKYNVVNCHFKVIDEALLFLVNRLKECGVELVYFEFCEAFREFSVVRVMLTGISCFDQLYFKNNNRLDYLSNKYFDRNLSIKYEKSLFM